MEICEACHVGRMRPEKVPYLFMHQGQMNVIPDVPALVCDCCHHTIHDASFMENLDQLINQSPPPSEPKPVPRQDWLHLLNQTLD